MNTMKLIDAVALVDEHSYDALINNVGDRYVQVVDVGDIEAAPEVDVMCGLPASEAMAVLHHYKNTGERLTEQYVNGYVVGFNECDRQYKEAFLKLAPPEGAESVQISMNRLSLGKTSDKTSDKNERTKTSK